MIKFYSDCFNTVDHEINTSNQCNDCSKTKMQNKINVNGLPLE